MRTVVLSVLSLLLLAGPLLGQDRRERRPGPQDRQEMERRVREQMSRMIREELGLTEETYRPVEEVMTRFREERRTLARSEQATRRRVEALMLEGAEDQGEAQELLGRMVELREQEAAIFREEQEALLDVLTPGQVLQLHALRERLSRRIRALRGRRGGEAPRDGHFGALGFHSGPTAPVGFLGGPGPWTDRRPPRLATDPAIG